MPYKIFPRTDGGVLIVGTGQVSARQAIAVNKKLHGKHVRTGSLKYKLIDLTEVTQTDASSDEMRTLASQDEEAARMAPGNFLIAIVGSRDIDFGLSRMWKTQANDPHLKTMIFRNRPDAENWIRVEMQKEAGN